MEQDQKFNRSFRPRVGQNFLRASLIAVVKVGAVILLLLSSARSYGSPKCSGQVYSEEDLRSDFEHEDQPVLYYVFSNKMLLSLLELPELVEIARSNNWRLRLLFAGEQCLDRSSLVSLLKRHNKDIPEDLLLEDLGSESISAHIAGIHYPASFFWLPERGFSQVVYGVMPTQVWEKVLQQVNGGRK